MAAIGVDSLTWKGLYDKAKYDTSKKLKEFEESPGDPSLVKLCGDLPPSGINFVNDGRHHYDAMHPHMFQQVQDGDGGQIYK